ncbi:MAG: hypothetical protein AAF674_12170 [Pseudomonadota bacterium]
MDKFALHKAIGYRPTYYTSFEAAKAEARAVADELGERFAFMTHERDRVEVYAKTPKT